MDNNLTIMGSMVSAITQTSEWFYICQNDPQIAGRRKHLDSVMTRISALIPAELLEELEDALCAMDEAQETAAILYGIRVAIAIRDASTRQTDLSQQVTSRQKVE